MTTLTQSQTQIVTAPLGAALVTAGAGSGKTRVLTQRVAHLAKQGEISKSILVLTFTNKAAKEIQERIKKGVGWKHPEDIFAGTFHSFCAYLLHKRIDRLEGYTKDFSIYDTKDTEKAIKEVLTSNTFLELGKDDVKLVEWMISQIKNENGRDEDYCEGEMLRAVRAYNALLRKNNALDFNDLLTKTLEVLDKNPDVLEAEQKRYKHILVDEFQDTNKAQYEIIKCLAEIHKSIMVVGDEDQCIYTWRGASIDNFKRFQKDFDVTVYKLEQNFRSSRNIVELADNLADNNQTRIKKKLFSHLPDGKIEFQSFFGAREEARFVVGSILKQKAKYSDFAIMVRINAMSRLFEEQLLDYNIPYVIWGGFKFFDRAEVKIVLNYLRVLLNPNDEVALYEIINFPRRGVGDTSIEKIKEVGFKNVEKHTDRFSKKTLSGIRSFRDVIQRLSTIHDDFGFLALAEHMISEIGLDRAYTEDPDRLENVYQLVLDIKEAIKQDPDLTLSMYLKRATLATDTDTPEINDRVVITTVHSAKGLEFKNVFVVGLEDGLFPIKRAFGNIAEMEEERRLLYVAVTRAMQNLHLSYANSRMLWGREETICKPSRFLKEMGFEYSPSRGEGVARSDGVVEIKARADTAQSLGFKIADKVKHEKFGPGEVLDVIDKNILKIKFNEVGVKMLSLAYAKLEKCENT